MVQVELGLIQSNQDPIKQRESLDGPDNRLMLLFSIVLVYLINVHVNAKVNVFAQMFSLKETKRSADLGY